MFRLRPDSPWRREPARTVLQVGWPMPFVLVTLAVLSGGSHVGSMILRGIGSVALIVVLALAVQASSKAPDDGERDGE